VQDLVGGILLAAETQTKSREIFFLSDGKDYRMEEIGAIAAQAMGIDAFRIRVPRQLIWGIACFSEYFSNFSRRPSLLNKDKAEEMIQKDWVCDITKAKTLLGFEPGVPLSEGTRLTFEWHKTEK
jgi:nucleoside-diphosphate-sugar epimerase